jgi:hypothetical protein
VSKRKHSRYRSMLAQMNNPACAAVKREAEEDWGRDNKRLDEYLS